jgi:hypothetical protein
MKMVLCFALTVIIILSQINAAHAGRGKKLPVEERAAYYIAKAKVKSMEALNYPRFVFCAEEAWLKLIPEKLRPVLALPKTKHEFLDPDKLVKVESSKLGLTFYNLNEGDYKVIDVKDVDKPPFILTNFLHECVGVAVVLPNQRVGGMHVTVDAYKKGELVKFMSHFEPDLRENCIVTFTSSMYSDHLENVYTQLYEAGFKISSADICPIYVQFSNGLPVGGSDNYITYIPYSQFGYTFEEVKRGITENEQGFREEFYMKLSNVPSKVPELTECPRILLLSVQTGASYLFFDKGLNGTNSLFLCSYLEFFNIVKDGESSVDIRLKSLKKRSDELLEIFRKTNPIVQETDNTK